MVGFNEYRVLKLNEIYKKYLNRVRQEEILNERSQEDDTSEKYNPDFGLNVTESLFVDLTRRIANTDRLIYIYTLTGLIIATVIITLIRSFIFFSV